jgi:hypothetical protein
MKAPTTPGDPVWVESRNVVVWVMLNTILLVFWAGFVVNDWHSVHAYTRIGPAAGSTFFNSARYDIVWWFGWLMSFNVFLPFILIWAAVQNDLPAAMTVHRIASVIVIFLDIAILAFFSLYYVFLCNTGLSGGSPCNDGLWCCIFLGTGTWCQNGLPCPAALFPNGTFLAMWISSGVAGIVAWVNILVGRHLRRVGFVSRTQVIE